MIEHRPFAELGGDDLGWLKAKHHFHVGGHGNPKHRALGDLIVWNDDDLAPGTGFPRSSLTLPESVRFCAQSWP